MSEMNDIIAKLDSFANLPIDWDSYGGLPVNQKSIDRAKEYLKILPPGNWQAVPGCCGDLQLELHEIDCDIEVYIKVL